MKWHEWLEIAEIKRFCRHATATIAAIIFFALPAHVAEWIHGGGWFVEAVTIIDAVLAIVVLLLFAYDVLWSIWHRIIKRGERLDLLFA